VYDGCAQHEGRKLHKLSFHPVDSLTGPDVQGSLYVDMETQLTALLDLRVANHPKYVDRTGGNGCEGDADDPRVVACYNFYRTRLEQRWFYGELTPGLEITYRNPKPDAPSR
jgi:hypothetical protein